MGKSSAFDLLGPIMVGPSSSHTAGAVRLGKMARTILGGMPERAQVILHGSFAQTGKGHGTHEALVAGLLGFNPDDERIPEALAVAQGLGLKVEFQAADLGDVHPNTVKFILTDEQGENVEVVGSSIGGGRIRIEQVNGFPVEITGDYPVLIVLHQDLPGVVAQVTSLLATAQVNIAQMRVAREKKGARALMVVETDQRVAPAAVELMHKVPAVLHALVIEPLH